MKRLNIFDDETGDFGFSENPSVLYDVSFMFREKTRTLGYNGMIIL